MLRMCACRRAAALRTVLVMTGLLATADPGFATDLWSDPPVTAPTLGPCSAPGSFALPGTDGCLRIGGTLAAGINATVPTWRGTLARPASAVGPLSADDQTRVVAQARLYADVRVPTDLGPFRAFVSIRNRHGF